MKFDWEVMWRILYPRRCPICQEIVAKPNAFICEECNALVSWIREPRCKKCGKQIRNMEQEYCTDCIRMPKQFEQGIALVVYAGEVRESLARIKYRNMRQDLDWFCLEVVKRYTSTIKNWKIQALVPVPIHASRRRVRGFNQAEEIAKRLAEKWNLPFYSSALLRAKKTTAQKELNSHQRLKNLEQAFVFGKLPINIEVILLIDDIYTTGSTMEACTRILLKNGVKRVYCLSLAAGIQ